MCLITSGIAIRVVMITGIIRRTAFAIAHQVGIPGVRVLTGEDLEEYQRFTLQEALAEVNGSPACGRNRSCSSWNRCRRRGRSSR